MYGTTARIEGPGTNDGKGVATTHAEVVVNGG
jgi:hypothetical protein